MTANSDTPSSQLPPDPDGLNDLRSYYADLAVRAFQSATSCDEEDVLGDLLADLMHWSDRNNHDFELAYCRAQHHYGSETAPANDATKAEASS